MENKQEERVRKEIANFIYEYRTGRWYRRTGLEYIKYLKDADEVLAIKGLRIEADDQSLPPNNNILISYVQTYNQAQQDMLTPDKDGCVWRKVIPNRGG